MEVKAEKQNGDKRLRNGKIAYCTKVRDTKVVHSGEKEADDNVFTKYCITYYAKTLEVPQLNS